MKELSESRMLQDRAFLGIFLMALGLTLNVLADIFVMRLLGVYSVSQTTFIRAAIRMSALFFVALMQGNLRYIFETKQPGYHFIRLATNIIFTYSFMYAFSVLSLTTIRALHYTTPLFTALLGVWVLKEKVVKEIWIAIAISTIGVLVAIRVNTSLFDIAALFLLVGIFSGSFNKILIRRLAATEHSLAIAIYPNLAMFLIVLPFVIFDWHPVSLYDLSYFALIGIITSTGQFAVTQSLRFAQASTLAPIDYFIFILVLLVDFFLWNKTPDIYIIIGSCVIVGSNFYLLYRNIDKKL